MSGKRTSEGGCLPVAILLSAALAVSAGVTACEVAAKAWIVKQVFGVGGEP